MKAIIWLASYPKSGNTWLRFFLANYILETTEPLSLNKINQFTTGDAVTEFYQKLHGVDFHPNDFEQIATIRNKAIETLSNRQGYPVYLKTHWLNANLLESRIIPPEYTAAAIYVIRNPLDMVISYSNHFEKDLDETISDIASSQNLINGDASNTLQVLGSWSDHVTSWATSTDFPVYSIRYEDLLESPEKTFGGVLEFLNIPVDEERLQRAITFSGFAELKKQEDEAGFIEQSGNKSRFFRSGVAGQWKSVLTPAQFQKIAHDHGAVMRQCGYTF